MIRGPSFDAVFTEREINSLRKQGWIYQDVAGEWRPTEKAVERMPGGMLERSSAGKVKATEAGRLMFVVLGEFVDGSRKEGAEIKGDEG